MSLHGPTQRALVHLVRFVRFALAATALVGSTAQGQTQSQIFEAAKAYGAAQAASGARGVRDGSAENETVRRTVPGYTASPAQAQSYGAKDAQAKAASQRAACASTPTDPLCSATVIGTAARPRSADLSPSSPALAAQAAADNPTSVLGAVASTYNACSVGGAMTAPATYARQSCTLDMGPWTDQACSKRLDVFPVETASCVAGSVLATGNINGAGPMEVKAYCNPAAGARVRVTAQAQGIRGACTAPIDVSVDLSTPQPLGATPPTRIGSLQPHWSGSCYPMSVFWEGGGCQNGSCSMTVHFAEGAGTEPRTSCAGAGEAQVRDIAFSGWTSLPSDYAAFCYSPYADETQAAGRVGDWGLANGVWAYWAQSSALVTSGWQWTAGLHYSTTLNFVEPRVIPARGDVWTNTCGALESKAAFLAPDGQAPLSATPMPSIGPVGAEQCVRTASVCTDGPSTRTISGVNVTRECWQYSNTFACATLAATSTCSSSGLSACTPVGSTTCAAVDAQGHCTQANATYECKTANATFGTALNCGNASFCSGGSCWDSTSTPNTAFSNAAAQLQAHIAAGKDIDTTTLQIFKGQDRRCHKETFGIDNCCDNTAYLMRCSSDEQETVRRREQGRCHEVGEYCSAGSIFGCRERTKAYCCFSSMLGRIVQEQGRLQIARDWGTPQTPSCQGFTADELARLDWSRFDLTEFYAHIHVATPPGSGAVTGSVQNKQPSCYYGEGRC